MHQATILALISALLLSVALVVLVLVFLGSGFHQSIELGLILMPGIRPPGCWRGHGIGDGPSGRAEGVDLIAVPTALVAVALYLILIPSDGAVGAAVASSLSYAFGFVLTIVVGSQSLAVRFLPLVIPTRSEIDDYVQFARLALRRVSPGG